MTNDKARVALEKMDGVSGAYVNNGITLLMSNDKPLDEEAIAKTLKEFKITVSETTKSEALPF